MVGGPGIGKTALLRAAAVEARDADVLTLTSSSAEGDVDLPFSALVDLLDPIVDDQLPGLPEPQRAALEVALLRRSAPSTGYDRLAVGLAVRTIVLGLARRRSVLLQLDDVHWMDLASHEAITWALRRFGDAPVAVISGCREPTAGLVPDDSCLMRLGPLEADAIAQLIRSAGIALSAEHLNRVVTAAQGNPLSALSLARASHNADLLSPALVVPDSVAGAVQARLQTVSAKSMRLLGRAAAGRASEPTLTESELTALDVPPDIAQIIGGHVRFAHPLFASLAYKQLTDRERIDVHRVLAAQAGDSVDRARHLALATTTPDSDVAAEIAAAAQEAERRGATAAAGALWEKSARLTPVGETASPVDRLLNAGRCFVRSGDRARAEAVLTPLVDVLPPGPTRGAALLELVDAAGQDVHRSRAFAEQALRDSGGDPEAKLALADLTVVGGRFEEALALYGDLVESPDLTVRSYARSMIVSVSRQLGRYDEGLARSWIQQEPPDQPVMKSVRTTAALMSFWMDDCEPVMTLLRPLMDTADENGDYALVAQCAEYLAEAAERLGDRRAARAYADRAQLSQAGKDGPNSFIQALVEADTDECAVAIETAEGGFKTSMHEGDVLYATKSAAVLQRALLTAGRVDLAVGEFLIGQTSAMHARHPAAFLRWHCDAVEMALLAGDTDRARAVTELFAELVDNDQLHSPNDDAAALRCQAVLALHASRADEAESLLNQALPLHELKPVAKERARTLLWLGMAQRRLRRRGDARRSLLESAALFEAIDAKPWHRRAMAELRRTGGGTGGQLTATEARIAELVVSGHTNREVAAVTSLAVKTVEANLSRIYRKLGVRSRSELTRRLTPVHPQHASGQPSGRPP